MKDKNNNTGKENSGNSNSGNRNSGHGNSGHWNSGHRNSGHGNSGDWNNGNWNSGHGNSGNRNSGHWNSGNRNSGHGNSGNRNSGHWNSGNRNSGHFNTDEPTVRMFNKDTGMKREEIDIPFVNLKVTEWIPEEDMTSDQKKADPNFHVKKGTLIRRTYKEAWELAWYEIDQETKDRFLNLPNFDADIFEEITGIDVKKENPCHGKIVEIGGKKYRLEEV